MIGAIQEVMLQDREHAGFILGQRLKKYEKTNTVVVGIPNNGVCVAAEIAKYLTLPLEVIPCQRIKHPADETRTLGSVSLNEVIIPDNNEGIPQDFVAHQVAMLKRINESELNFYYDGHPRSTLKYKTVIVVDDVLQSTEVMLACIREIKKQTPLKIIAAIPVVSAQAARLISAEVDDLTFLRMENEIGRAKTYFNDFSAIDRHTVKSLLHHSFGRKKIINIQEQATGR